MKNFLLLLAVLSTAGCFAHPPDTVKIGTYMISLHDFDFRDKQYNARFWLWAVYKNPKISFKEDVEIPNAKSINTDEIIEDTLPGRKWVQMKLNCTMKQDWEIDHFPFDKQELKIYVENSKFDKRSLVLVADTIGRFYDPKITVDGWEIEHFMVKTGTSHYQTGFGDETIAKPESDYSHLEITIHLQRQAWGLFFKLFLGMYVAFAISFVSFFIDPQHVDPRFGLPVGGLFASVGNKYVIDSYLPDASILTIVDKLHGLTFIMIFLIIAFSAVSLRYEETGKLNLSKRADRIMGFGLMALYLIINVYLIQDAYFAKHFD